MTVIAVKKEKDYIHLVCDSRLTFAYSERADKQHLATKIIKNNELYIGFSGSAAEVCFLDIYSKTHILEGNEIKDIVNYFHKFLLYYKEITANLTLEGQYIFVYHNKIFTICAYAFAVMEISTFASIGSGRPFAITALHLGKNAKEAVEIACELDAFCDVPIIEYKIPYNSLKKGE